MLVAALRDGTINQGEFSAAAAELADRTRKAGGDVDILVDVLEELSGVSIVAAAETGSLNAALEKLGVVTASQLAGQLAAASALLERLEAAERDGRISADELAAAKSRLRAQLLAAAGGVEELERNVRSLLGAEDATAASTESLADSLRELGVLTQEQVAAKMGLLNTRLENLAVAFRQGVIDEERYAEGALKVSEELDRLRGTSSDLGAGVSGLNTQMGELANGQEVAQLRASSLRGEMGALAGELIGVANAAELVNSALSRVSGVDFDRLVDQVGLDEAVKVAVASGATFDKAQRRIFLPGGGSRLVLAAGGLFTSDRGFNADGTPRRF